MDSSRQSGVLVLLGVQAGCGGVKTAPVSGRVTYKGKPVKSGSVLFISRNGVSGTSELDGDGRYQFLTIKPGAYPWRNHPNAWRPAHIHFSLFGQSFESRLVTQMYFPNDPLFPHDPILQSIPDERARERLVARFDLPTTQPEWALGYRFDFVLRGREATPWEAGH